MNIPNEPGTYVLVIHLPTPTRVRVGALGPVGLAQGYWCYVGSAMGGLSHRLRRHLRSEKRLHWHIDYVLQQGRIVEIWYAVGRERRECLWARALESKGLKPCSVPLGASDCACRTHLFHSATRPHINQLNSALAPEHQAQALAPQTIPRG